MIILFQQFAIQAKPKIFITLLFTFHCSVQFLFIVHWNLGVACFNYFTFLMVCVCVFHILWSEVSVFPFFCSSKILRIYYNNIYLHITHFTVYRGSSNNTRSRHKGIDRGSLCSILNLSTLFNFSSKFHRYLALCTRGGGRRFVMLKIV